MSEDETPARPDADPVAELRAHAEELERRLAETERETRGRIVRAELKVEAVRAGMVDLDGLKLVDIKDVELTSDGELANAAALMTHLKRVKPWLFGGTSSSSPASPPPAQPPRQKLATEMSDDEYRVARAAILKHQL